jgi:hypothetical protein
LGTPTFEGSTRTKRSRENWNNAGANANARTNENAGAEAGDDDCIILEHSGVDVKVLLRD